MGDQSYFVVTIDIYLKHFNLEALLEMNSQTGPDLI